MREIKFRVREIFNSVESLGWSYFTLGDLVCSNFSTNHKGFMGDTWTQYTGLKDKNGKEIYEGDVVDVSFLARREKAQVIFNNDFARYMIQLYNPYLEIKLNVVEIKGRNIEVIGNIYENPELLKGDLK